jgi:predicted Zn finger-like uncharacterized protein
MKIGCEKCGAQYDLDEARIPASGMMMKCPACLNQFKVTKPGAAAAAPAPAKKREIALSPMHEHDETPLPDDAPGMVPPDEIDLPAPKARPSAAPASQKKSTLELAKVDTAKTREEPALSIDIDTDDAELPAPVVRKPVSAQHAPVKVTVPQTHAPADDDLIDLPAPKAPSRPSIPSMPAIAISPPTPTTTTPPPSPPTLPKVAPPKPPASPSPPTAKVTRDDVIDLPAPKLGVMRLQAKEEPPELPAPKSPVLPDLPAPKKKPDLPDLLAPKRPSIGMDMDAPDPEDAHISLPSKTPSLGHLGDDVQALELDSIDLVAPKAAPPEEPDLLAPKSAAPSGEVPDLPAPKSRVSSQHRAIESDRSLDDPTPVEAVKFEPSKTGKRAAVTDDEDEDEEKPKRGWLKAVIAVAAVGVVVGGVGVGLGMFTSSGYFGVNLWSGKHKEAEARLMAARKQMNDDTPTAYRKAALDLQTAIENDPQNVEAIALAARAHYMLARLGVQSEQKTGDALTSKPEAQPAKGSTGAAEMDKTLALKALVGGKIPEARTKLNGVLAAAPADAAALELLGMTELAAGDAAAADKAFGKALASEPARTAALYGDGVAKERLGDAKAASDLYAKALAKSPTHFGALVGAARLGDPKEAQAKIDELVQKRAVAAAPHELADAWTTLGIMAAQAGRRDEAEDRLKRAVGLDAGATAAKVALANVQCDLGHCADSLDALGRIVGAEPKNFEARLALVRAQLDTGHRDEAQATMQPLLSSKDARVSLLVGKSHLGATLPDREKALAAFKDAIAADPKLIDAYLAESTTLSLLGKNDEALAALKEAETKAADDPAMMMELGRAYLTLSKPADAEARFRAALEKAPDSADAHIALAGALEAQSKLADAQKEYEAVVAKTPDAPGLVEKMARLAQKQGKKDEAWALYGKALTQGVPTAALRMAAADLALETGRVAEAGKLAGSVLQEDDRSAAAHLMVARVDIASGRADEGMVEARRASMIADLPEAHLTLAQALEQLGKLDQAANEYGLARRGASEAEASLGRARIMVRMGATKDALTELANLMKNPALKGRALVLTGDCYADLNQGDKARKAYEDAVKADPQSGEIAFKLGRVYYDAGKRKPAADLFERALKLEGNRTPAPKWAIEAWLLDGDVHRDAHERDAAVKAYKKYLELAPPDAPARNEVKKHLSTLGVE